MEENRILRILLGVNGTSIQMRNLNVFFVVVFFVF